MRRFLTAIFAILLLCGLPAPMFAQETLPQLQPPQPGEQVAVIRTNYGTMLLRLFPDKAPKTVENFVTHAKNGYYNGVTFHRVIDDFMIQGGDPTGTGMGGESIYGEPFEDELDFELRHFRGALSMANSGINTNNSQFFIVQSDDTEAMLKEMLEMEQMFPPEILEPYRRLGGTAWLDYRHTVFGQVYAGMDVVDAIAAVRTDEMDRPLRDVVVHSITITDAESASLLTTGYNLDTGRAVH